MFCWMKGVCEWVGLGSYVGDAMGLWFVPGCEMDWGITVNVCTRGIYKAQQVITKWNTDDSILHITYSISLYHS